MYPCQHRQITEAALRRFSAQNPAHSPLTQSQQEAIIVGSAQEDAPSWQRISNWHFFRSNDQMPIWRGFRFDSRGASRRCRSSCTCVRPRSYELIGRLLHHIQDMSTPSHVTPIYHGGVPADPYESWLKRQFANWPAKLAPLATTSAPSPAQRRRTARSPPGQACAEVAAALAG